MVNPGVFHGERKVFLFSKLPEYGVAYERGTLNDTLSIILQNYFHLFPIDKGPLYEPTSEERDAVERGETAPEPLQPDRGKFPDQMEYDEAMTAWKARAKQIKKIKGQIKRCLAYQHCKLHNITKRNSSGATNPYSFFAHQLADKPLKKPRLLSALSIWRRDFRDEINDEARAHCLKHKKSLKTCLAPIREQIANAKFNLLSKDERARLAAEAQREYTESLEKWKEDSSNPLKTDPESRQQCISNLPAVVQPFLDLIAEATGWKVTMIAGGPYPAHDGRLSMLSLHSGKTLGEQPMTFGRYEHVNYQKYVVPMFSRFMRKAFSVEECQSSGMGMEDDDDIEMSMPGLGDAETTGLQFQFVDASIANPTAVGNGAGCPAPSSPRQSSSDIPFPSRDSWSPFPREDLEDEIAATSAPSLLPSPHPPCPSVVTPPVSTTLAALPPGLAAATHSPAPHVAHLPGVPAPISPARVVPPIPTATATSLPSNDHSPSPALPDADPPQSPVSPQSVTSRKRPGDDLDDVELRKVPRTDPNGGTSKKAASKLTKKDTSSNWFMDAMRMFTEGSTGLDEDGDGTMGDEWVDLVGAWSAFQRAVNDIGVDSKLPTKNRPSVVKEWIARARSVKYRPTVLNVAQFEKEYRMWWLSMQPSWRVKDGQIDVSLVDGDWSTLRLPGVNGLLSVVAALFYWGLAARGNKAKRGAWTKAVLDCTVAFRFLLKAELAVSTSA